MTRLIALGFALLSLGTSLSAAELVKDAQAVRMLEETWLRASAEGDKDVMRTMLDDRYLEWSPGGHLRRKTDLLNAAPLPADALLGQQVLRVELHGDTAIVFGTDKYRAKPSKPESTYLFMDVLQRHDGTWRLIASQETLQGSQASSGPDTW